jgi:glycerate kinase
MAEKFIVIPDSFKGTMTSADVCTIMREQIARFFPETEVVSVPIADGGEGTVEAFLTALGGERAFCRVSGPFGEPVDASYGIIGGDTAILETSSCAGLPLAAGRLDPFAATTYGLGELMADAVRRGCRRLVIGLGGSCTNDAGAGMAAALGVRFRDADGKEFVPTGGTLKNVAEIDCSKARRFLADVRITAMCDVESPLYGPEGAAFVFAPQKGANQEDVLKLDAGLRRIAAVMRQSLGTDVSALPGGGAAGGMGAGMKAFLGAELQPGIQTVLELVRFDEMLAGARLVFTGEGRLDGQSVRGKVVGGVAKHARDAGVPVVAVVGDAGEGAEKVYDAGVTAVFPINRTAIPYEQAKLRSREDLGRTMEDILRLLRGVGY